MAYPNIEAILKDGGDITVGRVGPIECVASASTSYDCPMMLVRREGESFVALLRRLDRSTGTCDQPINQVATTRSPSVTRR